MATKEEVSTLKLHAELLKQLTREPGWQILDTQLEGIERIYLRELRSDHSGRGHSDDWYKGYLACVEMVRTKPDQIAEFARTLSA